MIPDKQLIEEERQQQMAMASQPPQEDLNMVLARAEEAKAQADLVDAQAKQQQVKAGVQIKVADQAIKRQELALRNAELELEKFKAKLAHVATVSDLKLKGAQTAKTLDEAENADIENDSVVSGTAELAGAARG